MQLFSEHGGQTDSLRMAHEQAGLKTIAAGYLGFVHGFLLMFWGIEGEQGGTLWPLSHTRNLRSSVDAGVVPTKEWP